MAAMNAISRAIERLTPSTQAELARQLHTTPQEVNRWIRRGWAAPKYAPAIERLTGVTCSELVADLNNKNAQAREVERPDEEGNNNSV